MQPSGKHPCDMRWKLGPRSQSFCLNLPAKAFRESAENLSQMLTDDPIQRFVVSYVQFFIHALYGYARILGTPTGDSYLNLTDPDAIDRLRFGGEGLSTPPKYSIAVEYLVKNAMGLQPYSPDDVTDINKIFNPAEFSGIRLWFLIFDDNLDIMEVIKNTLDENAKDAVSRCYQKHGKSLNSRDRPRDISSSEPTTQQDSEYQQGNQSATDQPPGTRPRGRPRNNAPFQSGAIDPRTAHRQTTISDPSEYFRAIRSFADFGRVVDFLRNDSICARSADALNSPNYPILSKDNLENQLHFLNWGTSKAQQWLLLSEDGDSRRSIVCRMQTFTSNYIRGCDETQETWFEFPFPQLVFLYNPEECSLDQMFKRTLPWMNLKRFTNLYAEIKEEYVSTLAGPSESPAIVPAETEQTQYSREHLEKIRNFEKRKQQCLGNNPRHRNTIKYHSSTIEAIKKNSILLPPRRLGSSEAATDTDSVEELLVDAASFNKIAELSQHNHRFIKMLDEIRIICPGRYPEAIALLMEELLPSFSRVCHSDVKGNSKGVKALLDWFQLESGIRISNNEGYDEYGEALSFTRSLCHESPTFDPSIGPYGLCTPRKLLELELVGKMADAHCSILSLYKHAIYCYVNPQVAIKAIGTAAKSLVITFSGPGRGKSFEQEFLDSLLVRGTVAKLNSITNRSMETGGQGSNHLTDAVILMDEANNVLTQDPKNMDSKTLESYGLMKSIISAQETSLQVCHINKVTGGRRTLRIVTPLSLCILTSANQLNYGTDTALTSRSIVYLARPNPDRCDDKNLSSLAGSAASVYDKHNFDTFALKVRIEQYLFCMICKMLQTGTIPIGVNIEIGTILYGHVTKFLAGDYPILTSSVRTTHKLFINFYTQAILDAINICFFSEASPFKILSPDGSFKYLPFSYEQLQQCMPALCLSEDSAILVITEWLALLHNRVLYQVCLKAAQEWGNWRFPHLASPVISDSDAEEALKTQDPTLYNTLWAEGDDEDDLQILGKRKKLLEQMKSAITDSTFFPCRTPIPGGKYAPPDETPQQLAKSISYRRRGVANPDGEWTNFLDTGFVSIPCKSISEFIANVRVLIGDPGVTVDVIQSCLRETELNLYTTKTLKAPPIFCMDGKTLAPANVREHIYPTGKSLTFKPIEIVPLAPGQKPRIYISSHFLQYGSHSAMVRTVLRCLCYRTAIPRNVVVAVQVPRIPFLLQTYKITPYDDLPLVVINGGYVNPSVSSRIFGEASSTGNKDIPLPMARARSSTHNDSMFKAYVTPNDNQGRFYRSYENLELEIFTRHFADCGKPPGYNYFLPSNIKEQIREYHKLFPPKDGKSTIYPLSLVYDIVQSSQKSRKTISNIVSSAKVALENVLDSSKNTAYIVNDEDDSVDSNGDSVDCESEVDEDDIENQDIDGDFTNSMRPGKKSVTPSSKTGFEQSSVKDAFVRMMNRTQKGTDSGSASESELSHTSSKQRKSINIIHHPHLNKNNANPRKRGFELGEPPLPAKKQFVNP